MKTYRNDELGFELLIPDNWLAPLVLSRDNILFDRLPFERFNFVVGPLNPERLLESTQIEFIQYARSKGYTNVEFGGITIENSEHVWARYNMGNDHWTKKYMIVFGYIEYAITATCYDKKKVNEYANQWDNIVKTFRLLNWRKQQVNDIKQERMRIASELYEKGYEAAAEGRYQEACLILESCLKENPDHILAHKELAFILKNTGNVKGALVHRQIVKQLDPTDQVNQYNLSIILFMLGSKEEAIHEIDDLIIKYPYDLDYINTKEYFQKNK
jgi:tetratricopeptide (TPR) repeat protein